MKNILIITILAFAIFSCQKEHDPVFTGDVILTTQKELDDFGKNNYEVIDGNLQIGLVGDEVSHASDIVYDAALASLKRIEGNLIISYTSLHWLDGLTNLTHIGGDFIFSNNERITEIEGLTNITYIGGSIEICYNLRLIEIRDFEHFNPAIKSLSIRGNQRLKKISGLRNITSIAGNLIVRSNYRLENVDFLINLTSISGDFIFSSNHSITDLNGLIKLESVGGYTGIYIENNWSLRNLDGLANLSNVTGRIFIGLNRELTDFCGLSKLLEKFENTFDAGSNKYNPSKQDILDGNCAM